MPCDVMNYFAAQHVAPPLGGLALFNRLSVNYRVKKCRGETDVYYIKGKYKGIL